MTQTVLIDGFNLSLARGTGIATYSRNLSHALHAIGKNVDVLYATPLNSRRNDKLKEISFFDVAVRERLPAAGLLHQAKDVALSLFGHTATRIPIAGTVIAEQFRGWLPYYDQIWTVPELFRTAQAKFDILNLFTDVTIPRPPAVAHWTYPLPIRVRGSKNIYTIHDLVPLRLPYATLDNKRLHYSLIRRLLKQADHIVTVSEASKRDICNLFGVREDRVTNTYQSVEIPRQFTDKSDEQVKREIEGWFGVPHKEYFLFYGAMEPKKNVLRIIEAYASSNVETPLVLVGSVAWLSAEEISRLNSYLDQKERRRKSYVEKRLRIVHTDYIPFPQLISLVRGAKALLFPSLYEGFGLPVLESMLLKTPVLSSNQGSIPEIAGDAAMLVNPYDVGAISQAIIELDKNADLRGELSRRGSKQAALFSPERYQQRLFELYGRLGAS